MSTTESTTIRRRLQTYLRSLSRSRTSGVVTAEDAHRWLQKNGVRTRNVSTLLSYINSTLRSPNFMPVGFRNSSRPASRGRRIRTWIAN